MNKFDGQNYNVINIKTKTFNNLMIFMFGCLFLLMLEIFSSASMNTQEKTDKKNEINKNSSTKHNKKIIFGSEFYPVKAVITKTDYIGTSDHPTIDGGIINSVEFQNFNHEAPFLENKQIDNHSVIKIGSMQNENKPFSDKWVSDEKIKQILEHAAKDGKLSYILKRSQEMHIPSAVAILPLVESSYQSNAISPKGAGGDWQIMPVVAKHYGITNKDRFQFTASTDVVLQLLATLHKKFGNWELAFAAYNAGGNRIQNALNKNPAAKSIDDLSIPNETKIYVNRIKNISDRLVGEISYDF